MGAQSSTLLLNARSDPMSTYRKDEGSDDSCFTLFSSMAFNNLMQSFPNNPTAMLKDLLLSSCAPTVLWSPTRPSCTVVRRRSSHLTFITQRMATGRTAAVHQ